MIFVALTVTRETIEDIRGPFLADNIAWSIAIIAMLLVLAVLAFTFFWPQCPIESHAGSFAPGNRQDATE